MGLRWFIRSVCVYALGYSIDGKPLSDDGTAILSRDPNEGNAMPRKDSEGKCPTEFRMPLHYPRYKKADYDNMEDWRINMLLAEYGLCFKGTLEEKRAFAIGAFLWPGQL